MAPQCTVHLFADDTWHDVATVLQLGHEEQGCLTQTYSGYAIDWVLAHGGAKDVWAIASFRPVVPDASH